MLYTDDTPLTPADPVAPARRSPAANTKAGSHRTPDGLPAYNLTDLINELGTICRNQLRIGDTPHTSRASPTPTPFRPKRSRYSTSSSASSQSKPAKNANRGSKRII